MEKLINLYKFAKNIITTHHLRRDRGKFIGRDDTVYGYNFVSFTYEDCQSLVDYFEAAAPELAKLIESEHGLEE
jgi:hypothetical protein